MNTRSTSYDRFDRATADLTAYAILDTNNEYVAKAIFRFPKAGSGRVTCFLQVFGVTMTTGYASGYGYDKTSAAFRNAAAKLLPVDTNPVDCQATIDTLTVCLADRPDGHRWSDAIEHQRKFKVLNVI